MPLMDTFSPKKSNQKVCFDVFVRGDGNGKKILS
jgi:hypothetical protein